MNAYFDGLRRYFDFSGRSTQSDYWVFTLALLGLALVTSLLDDALRSGGVLLALLYAAHLIPSLAVTVRRLHDIDRSGWWVLIGLMPLIGVIVLLVFACTPSTAGANRFGPHPKAGGAAAGMGQTATASSIEQLERLASLKASCAIDEQEFQRMKGDMLARAQG